ncbi:MAG: hypothetical protein BJ554DRAFT_4791 [Olpidium bornovanus]|uniref:Uncharacterized protein n=1 Tax=Olpidium bornovanus TaxID=278681 RepID=A0A8H7ZMB2_9FUNG|nr:MAG: hypothetical protein BJ554DRAFT_4791 [Olpidium bornovanus]
MERLTLRVCLSLEMCGADAGFCYAISLVPTDAHGAKPDNGTMRKIVLTARWDCADILSVVPLVFFDAVLPLFTNSLIGAILQGDAPQQAHPNHLGRRGKVVPAAAQIREEAVGLLEADKCQTSQGNVVEDAELAAALTAVGLYAVASRVKLPKLNFTGTQVGVPS